MSRLAVWRNIKAPPACKKAFSSTMCGVDLPRAALSKAPLHSRGARARPVLAW